MTEDELAAAVFAATDVLRVETLPAYAVDSDEDWFVRYLTRGARPSLNEKRPWLDRIAAAPQPWRRLRLIHDPISEYEMFQADWSYGDNADAGEDVRIVDAAEWADGASSAAWVGDVYFLDGRVLQMRYDHDGRFRRADDTGDAERARITESVWAFARPFGDWWAVRSDLHRAVSA